MVGFPQRYGYSRFVVAEQRFEPRPLCSHFLRKPGQRHDLNKEENARPPPSCVSSGNVWGPSPDTYREAFASRWARDFNFDDPDVRAIAAIGLVHYLWRNTDVVESLMHAGHGEWSDLEMLRINSWFTAQVEHCLAMVATDLAAGRRWSPARFARAMGNVFSRGTLHDGTPVATALGAHFQAYLDEVEPHVDYLRMLAARKSGFGIGLRSLRGCRHSGLLRH